MSSLDNFMTIREDKPNVWTSLIGLRVLRRVIKVNKNITNSVLVVHPKD